MSKEVKETKSKIEPANTTLLNTKQEVKKDKKGRWIKGTKSPNPHGAGLHEYHLKRLFAKAFVEDSEIHEGKDLFKYAFGIARTDIRVLLKLLDKFVPDLIKGEGFDSRNITQIFQDLTATELKRLAYPTAESKRIS